MILYHSAQRVERNPEQLGSGGTGEWEFLAKPGGGRRTTLTEPLAPPRGSGAHSHSWGYLAGNKVRLSGHEPYTDSWPSAARRH